MTQDRNVYKNDEENLGNWNYLLTKLSNALTLVIVTHHTYLVR